MQSACNLNYGRHMRAAMRALLAMAAAAALAKPNERTEWNNRYLEKLRYQKDVIATPSGLLYKVLEEGGGKRHPGPTSEVLCHYEGKVAFVYESGKRRWQTFDSSYKREKPNEFTVDGVIQGWTEALQIMVEGDKWELTIPSKLAYQDDDFGPYIRGGDFLVFTLELLEIRGETVPASRLRDPAVEVELTSLAHYEEWAEDARPPMILAVLRQPLYGQKLLAGLRGAQRYLAVAGGASCAVYAQSRFDGKTNRYSRSELEEALDLQAPAIYTTMGDVGSGTKWTACDGVHMKRVETAEDVTRAIIACARATEKEEL